MKYEIIYAPVGATDKQHVWRVDQVDNETGNWNTIAGGLTKAEAQDMLSELEGSSIGPG